MKFVFFLLLIWHFFNFPGHKNVLIIQNNSNLSNFAKKTNFAENLVKQINIATNYNFAQI